jgi:selenocysteine-specific elongation factor
MPIVFNNSQVSTEDTVRLTQQLNAGGRASKPAPMRSIVLGTAGHIDHGKTSLVFRLTGTDTDRLPEEKSRGITIDLGFAAMRFEDERIELSLVDVPGHHAFVRNMLAGAGGIDCVMLVIAADDGVKPQTTEHLAICALLGVRHGIVVLTKKDAVNAEHLQRTGAEVEQFLRNTFLQHAPVLAVSARTGEGIAELKAELARLAARIPERSADFLPRLPLDRAFSMKGFGTVVTGTLQAGSMRVGDNLELQPGARIVRVRSLQVHGSSRDHADAPCRLALNLAAVDVRDVKRGDTLIPPATLSCVSTLDAEVVMLAGVPPLKHRSRVRLHAFTSDALATVLRYENDAIPDQNTVLIRLRLSEAMLLAPGDRFVLRQASPPLTIGGGRVLDAHPLPRLRKAAALAWLKQINAASRQEQLRLRIVRQGVAGISLSTLIAETALTTQALQRAIEPLLSQARVVAARSQGGPHNLLASESLEQASAHLLRELGRMDGEPISRAELRSKTRLSDWVFELALRPLLANEAVQANRDNLRLTTSSRNFSAQDAHLAQVEELYIRAGLASPILSEVSEKTGIALADLHRLITQLLRAKKLVRMGADNLFIHADALDRLTSDLRQHRGETFDVARFKSFTGLTRKHAIPLLEYLDRMHVTRNNSGTRAVS